MTAFAQFAAAPAAPTDLLQAATLFHDCRALVYNVNCTAALHQASAPNATLTATTVGDVPCVKLGTLTDVGGFAAMRFIYNGLFPIQGKRTVHFLLYCENWLALANFSSIQVIFDNGAGAADTTNYLSASGAPTAWIDKNWCLFTAQFSEAGTSSMSYAGTAATVQGLIVTGNVRQAYLRVPTGVGVPDVYCAGVWFGGRTRPKIVISYDGCYISQLNVALVKHQLFNIPGTLYVTRSTLGSAGRFTESDLDTFYDAGWAIGMHSSWPSGGYDQFSSTQQIVELIGEFQSWQRSRGFTKGLGHLCWPNVAPQSMNAAQRAIVMPAILQSGIKTMRHAAGQSPVSAKCLAVGDLNEAPKHVFSPQLQTNGSPVTVATALGYLKSPTIAGCPAHVYLHEITPNGSSGGGDGVTNSVGTNYWRDDFFSGSQTAFMEQVATAIRAGLYDADTIALYDRHL